MANISRLSNQRTKWTGSDNFADNNNYYNYHNNNTYYYDNHYNSFDNN